MYKAFTGIIILFVGGFLGITAVGFFSSSKYQGSLTKTISAPPEKIWNYLTDLKELTKNRPEVLDIEDLGKNEKGLRKWKEKTDMGGYIIFEIIEEVPYQKITMRMSESTFAMTGTWTYELEKQENETRVTIKEDSELHSVYVRSVLTFYGRDANLKQEMDLIDKSVLTAK